MAHDIHKDKKSQVSCMETAVSVGNTCIWQENSGFQ
jgi:hypothetical protein